MNCLEAENVCNFLRSKDIHLKPNNEWLNSCIKWYKNHPDLGSVYGSLQDYVCIQWSLADLQDIRCGSLPTRCKEETFTLNGKFAVQINWIRDIGQSCYSQMQAIQNKNHAESNDTVSADEPRKQNWEPNPKRVLMLEITDGITTLKGLEYSPLEKIFDFFIPGLKVLLTGPVECRKGTILLKNNNISLLGGEVDHLYELNSKENLLSRCLNLQPHNPISRDRNNYNTANRIGLIQNNAPELIRSIMPTERPIEEIQDNNMLLPDEDDDFLCQLPDEVLGIVNSSPQVAVNDVPSTSSNYIRQTNQCDRNKSNENITHFGSNKAIKYSKPTLFPSLEDLRSINQDERVIPVEKSPPQPRISSSKVNQAALGTPSVRDNIQSVNISSTSETKSTGNNPLVNSFEESNRVQPISKATTSMESVESKNKLPNFEENITEDSFLENMVLDEVEYPILKEILVKVDCITKIKIRNGEWYCCVKASFEDHSESITFSNKVLDEIFGIAASRVEVWREEMANNPALKNKVNDILKSGQTKLKALNCLMTLEYSSEDCIPEVVKVTLN